MQSGLYGCSGLPGGQTTKDWNASADYLTQCVSPVLTERSLTSSKRANQHQNVQAATGLRPAQIRQLLQTLSKPELLHVLKNWHIEDKSGLPLGDKIHKNALIDLVMEHEGALGDVVRVATADGRRPDLDTLARIRINGARSTTPNYCSVLDQLSATQQLLRQPSTSSHSKGPRAQLTAGGGAAEAAPSGAGAGDDTLQLSGSLDNMSLLSTGVARQHRRVRASKESRGLMRRFVALRDALAEEVRLREECTLALARKGLLSTMLDGDISKGVAKGKEQRTVTVQRQQDTLGTLTRFGVNRGLKGIVLEELVLSVKKPEYGPSALSLCP